MLVVWASGFAQDTETIDLTAKGLQNATVVSEVTGTDVKLSFAKGKNTNNAPTYYTADKTVRLYVNNTLTISSTTKKIAQIEFTLVPDDKAIEPNTESFSTGNYSASTHTWTGNTNKIILTQKTNKKQFRIQKLVITFVKEGPSKTATTLTFPKPTINIEEGNEANFVGQPATLKAGETVLNNAITYITSNDGMFEAYDANVGPKTLKVGAYGTAVVTATFAGDGTYAASTATYTVNYTEKAKPATTLNFGFTTKTVNIDETFTAAATLKSGETAITGAVTYSSSKPEVAYVDKATGEVLALTAGKTTITATFASTSEYKGTTATYELTVVDPNAIVPLVFDKADDVFGTLNYYDSDNATISEYSLKGSDGNSYTFKTDGGKDAAKNGNLKLKKNAGTLESPIFENLENGYTVNITFSQLGKYPLEITSGEDSKEADITSENGKNTEGTGFLLSMNIKPGNTFTLNAGNVAYISKIEIVAIPGITLDEAADDTDTKIKNNNGKTLDVTLARTLTADKWNTICLPFDVTAKQIADVLKSEGNVKEFDREDASKQTIYFKDATAMKAGVPYLIKPTESATELVFKGVTIKNVDAADRMVGDKYNMCGVFGKYKMNANGTELFLTTQGKFAVPAPTTNVMRGFRAYFLVPKNTASAALNLSFGEATGIDGVAVDAVKSVKIYNVNGQYVGTNLDALPKGLYVVGGKKVLK